MGGHERSSLAVRPVQGEVGNAVIAGVVRADRFGLLFGITPRGCDLNTRLTTAIGRIRTIVVMIDVAKSMRPRRRVDLVVVMLLLVLVMIGTSRIEPEPADRPVDWLAFVCGAVAVLALMWWRHWAVAVAGVVSIVIGVYLARRYPAGPVLLPGPLAMFSLGYVESRRVSWMGVGGLLVTVAIGLVIAEEELPLHLLFFLGWGAAAVLAGQALAARGERAAAARERVAHAQEQALANERLRIAQDLHDSVAHAMATINVQSGVAAHLVEHRPGQAAVALEAIRVASRDALDELGEILGLLRESGSSAPLTPLAGLGELTELVERARADGVTVALDQTGDVAGVPVTVSTAAYRAVQEALTNTRRHAGPVATVNVTVAAGENGSLHVTVADDGGHRVGGGAAAAQSSGGFGLIGMRERVESSGGSLRVGPASRSGFLVEASWPARVNQ